jgi:2-acylglycerol O-acyltransferase 2/2-acylglycerol O-acyltransferase 1
MSLNPEPSAPEERVEHNLPPKSYADAAEEGLEPESHANGIDGTDGTIEQPGKWLRGKINEVKTNGIKIPSEEDKTSLEGIGQDTPRSPTVKGHRHVSSRSSQGSLGRKQGEQMQNDLYEKHPNGNGNGNGNALTSVKPQQELQLDKVDNRTDLKRRNSELTTGRQAGAGWSKSK